MTLSVSAASYNKRVISDGVQSCINGLNTANSNLLGLTDAVKGFTSAAGYGGAIALHKPVEALETLLKSINTACCSITTTVSHEEATTVFDLVADFVPNVTGSLDVIISKKPEFAAVLFADIIIKNDVKVLADLVKKLDSCLISAAPEDLLDSAQSYIDVIDAKLDSAFTAYGITA
ncbi:hypothetical protein INT47_006131 [Mucor saturninus]|uniref:Uncharacterized protein n=1 Tax=Mucor saturninus TaxID=64648 RepID=A0A8H7RDD6_9FUNG|nr:hypothetical protein INT47_006131 [Mucor saturninus]